MPNKFTLNILNELFIEVTPATGSTPADCQTDVYKAFGGQVLIVRYSGAIGLSCMDTFKPSLFATLTGDAKQIVVGLGRVSEISRSTLGALIDFAATVLGRGKKMYLLSPPESLEKTLKELQLTIFFEILHGEEDLIRILPDD